MEFETICKRLTDLAQTNQLRYTLSDEGVDGFYTTAHGVQTLKPKGVAFTEVGEGKYCHVFDPYLIIDQERQTLPPHEQEAYIARMLELLKCAILSGALPLGEERDSRIPPPIVKAALPAVYSAAQATPLLDTVSELLRAKALRTIKSPDGKLLSIHATPAAAVDLRHVKVHIPVNAKPSKLVEQIARYHHYNLNYHSQLIEPDNLFAVTGTAEERLILQGIMQTASTPDMLQRRGNQRY